MTPGDRNERQFTEDIDRILRGEEPLVTDGDAEYVDTLQFAQRLLHLAEEPREEFAGSLRHRLVVDLATQDARAEASGAWFVRVFSRPSLRLAVVSTFIVIAAIGLMWRAGMLSPMMPQLEGTGPDMLAVPPPEAPDLTGPQMSRVPDEAVCPEESVPLTIAGYVAPTADYGEVVSITIVLRNEGADPLTIAPFPPRVHIRDAATGIIVYTFEAGESRHALLPMASIRYELPPWHQVDHDGARVAPGRYEVDVEVIEIPLEKGELAKSWDAKGITAFDILAE